MMSTEYLNIGYSNYLNLEDIAIGYAVYQHTTT